MSELNQTEEIIQDSLVVNHEQVVVNEYLKLHRHNQIELTRLEKQVKEARTIYKQKRTIATRRE